MKAYFRNIKITTLRSIMLLTGALAFGSSAFAQTGTVLDTTRTWVSYENVDLYSNVHLQDTFSIQLSATAIRLASIGRELEFPVSNVEGNWTSMGETGEVTFDVTVLDLAGKGLLQRTAGELVLVIDLSERKDWMKRRFIITEP